VKISIGAAALALLSTLAPARAAELAGKTVFEQSCKNCHGAEGKGDRMADKYYQMTIPRLTSDYVQNKSDAELRQIITKGVRKMEPARMGQPKAPHRMKLTDEQVSEAIAYVRSLKK